MTDVRSISPSKYNTDLAAALKKSGSFKTPDFVQLVKTSAHKKRPTSEEDFYLKRAASILRQVYIRGVVGTERLRTRYGGKKDRGGQPEKFVKSGGKVIRTILQQAEAAGLLEKSTGKKKGRQLTKKGKELLESIK